MHSASASVYGLQTAIAQFLAVCRRFKLVSIGTRPRPRCAPFAHGGLCNGEEVGQLLSQCLRATNSDRSYWIPGSSAPALPEKGNALIKPLIKKGFQEDKVTTMRLDDLDTSTTLESNKSPSS